MGDLLLIRRGETEWSRSGRHTGWTDVPLTEHGREEGARPGLADPLAPDRGGVRQPAATGAGDGSAHRVAETRVDVDLREWDYGGYEGVTTVEIQRERPGWFLFTDGVAHGPPERPGGTPGQVGKRADRMLAKVDAALADTEGVVVLVAYGHFLHVLTARRLALPPSGGALFQLAAGTMRRLGTEHGRPVIAGWNIRARPA